MLTPGCFWRKGQQRFWWVGLLPLAARGKESERLLVPLGSSVQQKQSGSRPWPGLWPDPKLGLVLQKAWVCGEAFPKAAAKDLAAGSLQLGPRQSLGHKILPSSSLYLVRRQTPLLFFLSLFFSSSPEDIFLFILERERKKGRETDTLISCFLRTT